MILLMITSFAVCWSTKEVELNKLKGNDKNEVGTEPSVTYEGTHKIE